MTSWTVLDSDRISMRILLPPNPTDPVPSALSSDTATMSDFKPNSFKHKNRKGLKLIQTPVPSSNPSEGDAQIPGARGNLDSNRNDTLEIGLEFKLDLRNEDLIVLKELGAGNGGTVSKVMHASTKVIMAKKVSKTVCAGVADHPDHPSRRQRERPKADCPRTPGRT